MAVAADMAWGQSLLVDPGARAAQLNRLVGNVPVREADLRTWAADEANGRVLRVQAHAWLGSLAEERGDQAAARAEFRRAVELFDQAAWAGPWRWAGSGFDHGGSLKWYFGTWTETGNEFRCSFSAESWLILPAPITLDELRRKAEG